MGPALNTMLPWSDKKQKKREKSMYILCDAKHNEIWYFIPNLREQSHTCVQYIIWELTL